jgi:glycosyltransferase involved in cell wall biosynthesis
MKKLISIVTPCYNESENIEELCSRIAEVMRGLPYDYEHICIDNASTDDTVRKLKGIASKDARLKIIIAARNFGHIRSTPHALLQAKGDACIGIASDLQDPPEIIPEFLKKWEEGYKTVLAVKQESEESVVMFFVRRLYYKFLAKISEVPLVQNTTGAGLYDREVINIFRSSRDPYPYFRGFLSEFGLPIATVLFKQSRRKRGISKNNFFALYDIAMLGITNHSKIPLRIMTMLGFIIAILSLSVAIFYLIVKIFFWDSFSLGTAPILIGIFFFGALQAFFIGFLGEYIGAMHTQVRYKDMPLVIEKERVNF